MRLREKSVLLLATGCFIGNIPLAPGTFGTLVGLPICFLLSLADIQIAVVCIILFIIAAIFISHEAEQILDTDDPKSVVIDEMAGILVALAGLPFQPVILVSGFIIFRLLDIFKPFPIKQIETRLSGGTGIVMDDVVAGVMSNILIRIVMLIGGWLHLSGLSSAVN